jgi:hypothetical protein
MHPDDAASGIFAGFVFKKFQCFQDASGLAEYAK